MRLGRRINRGARSLSSIATKWTIIMPVGIAVLALAGVFAWWSEQRRLDIRVDYVATHAEGASRGTLFLLRGDGVECAAGYINTVATRTYQNQNNLEFYCREKDLVAPMEWYSVGKPKSNNFTTLLANIDGQLVDLASQRTWTGKAWEGGLETDGFLLNRLQRGQETYDVTIYGRCGGVSVSSSAGYHGSIRIPEADAWSAIHVGDGYVIANLGHKIWRGKLPAPSNGECQEIPVEVIHDERDWVYAMLPTKDGVLFGATSVVECPNLNIIYDKNVETIALPADCAAERVNEIYSFTPYYDQILIGNYPDGRVIALRNGATTWSDFATLRPDDYLGQGVRPYRESQSLVAAHGRVYVGMYPWAEMYVYEDEAQTVTRLFSFPEKRADLAMPFFDEMSAITLDVYNANADVPVSSIDSVPEDSNSKLWERGYGQPYWAQRISSIAVLDGKICAGTGNMSGGAYDPMGHPITQREADHYGAVHCASVHNQLLVDARKDEGELRFVLTNTRLKVYNEDGLVGQTNHDLGLNALKAISQSRIKYGAGPYGPFLGTISHGM